MALSRRAVLASGAAGLILPHALRAQTPKRGGTLRVAALFNPSSLDPVTGHNGPDLNTLFCLFDTLIDFDPKTLELRPGLAKAWRFTDPKTLELDLDDGIVFHDGTPLDADAVKFNLERGKTAKRTVVKTDLAAVESVEARGKTQVVLHLNRTNAALPTILTDRAGMMFSPKAIKEGGDNLDRKPVGTGPFKFVSWDDNDRIVLARNDKYRKPGQPYLDGLNIRIMNEQATALRAVIAGEADFVANLQPVLKPIADRAANLVTVANATIGVVAVYLNWGKPPLDDVRLRQAINYAVDRDALNKAVAQGLDEPTSTILPRSHWACDPATAGYYSHDPERARKLVADAGFPNGVDIPMVGWSDQASMQRQEVLIEQLKGANIRIQLTPMSAAESSTAFFGPAKKGAGRIAVWSGRPDPSQIYDELFSKDAFYNAGGADTPGFAALLEATEDTIDQAARKTAFAKLQKLVVEQALMLPLMCTTELACMPPQVKNYAANAFGKPKFHEVYLAG